MLAVIFSKDRPLQLDATLRSLLSCCRDFFRVSVRIIVKASNEQFGRAYNVLENDYSQYGNVLFISEENFRQQVLDLLRTDEHVLWLVDDNVFVREFQLADCCEMLAKNPDALGYSLRLGSNTGYCYSLDREQAVPHFDCISEKTRKYDWTVSECDFGYPLEVSSSVFRTGDLRPFLEQLRFHNPNSLEAEMAARVPHFREAFPYLLCPRLSITFCNPINKVQTTCENNRAGTSHSWSAEELAQRFLRGDRIDTRRLHGFIPNACHQEVDLKFAVKHDSPLVSVVIPCYNQAQFLGDAVDSVVGQTYPNWECLIVNDGSPDNTSEVARGLMAKYRDKPIYLHEKPNGGLADARNYGIARAGGKYILPFDCDDVLHPEMLSKTTDFLESTPHISIVYTDLIHFGAAHKHVVAGEYDFETLRYANQLNYCSLYRRHVWEAVGGYNTNMVWGYEDWNFWIGCGERGFHGQHLPEALLYYRVKNSSMFTKALEHHDELMAQIVMNHPRLYSEQERAWARGELDKAKALPPLVSVIVPTYNRPETLRMALESILNQSFSDFEIVVVNDAGSDVSAILKTLPHQEKVVYLRHQANRGLAATRNTGIRAAKGKYIAYLDDDDAFYPEHLATLVQRLESDGSFVAYTDAHRVHLEERDGVPTVIGRDLPYSEDFDYQRILFDNFIPVLCVMHRRECLEQVGGFDPLLHRLEDWDLWIRMSRHYQFHHVPTVTCAFSWRTEHGATMTSANWEAFDWARLRVSHKSRTLLPQVPAAMAWQAEFVATAAGRLTTALDSALAARRYEPRTLFGTGDLDEVLSCARPLSNQHPEHRDLMARLLEQIESYARLAPESGPAAPKEADPSPVVSVIVPTFNRPETLRMALESILNQSFPDFEIVVVNDAGCEVSAVLETLPHRERIVYLRHQVNRGLAAARNTGIAAARGRYIAYLDDDDIYYPDHLETLVHLLQTHQHQVAYTDAFRALQRCEQGTYRSFEKEILYSCDFDYQRILVENFIPILCVMHEKSCLLKSGLFDESLKRHEDWDLWIRMSRHFRFAHIPKATCEFTFRADGDGMTSGTLPTFLESMRHVFRKHAHEVAGDHLLRQRQKHALMQLNLRIFSFLTDRIAPFASQAASFHELQQTGATETQIRSAQLYLQGKKSSDMQEAVLLLEKALAECPENHQAGLDLLSRYLETGAYTQAAARLTELAEADPGERTFAELRVLLQDRLAAGDSPTTPVPAAKPCPDGHADLVQPFPKWAASQAVYLGMLQRDPDDTEALLNLGRICASRGRTDDARLLYDRILALTPYHPRALKEMAQLSSEGAPQLGIDVSVVIPAFNQAGFTKDCLEAFFAVTGKEHPVEVIVVDNASTDWTPEYLKSLEPRIRVLSNDRNLGFAKACNQGARAARGRYLIFLNNDTVPKPGWLKALIQGAEIDGADLVGAKLLYPDGTVQHAGVGFADPGNGVHVFKGMQGDHPAVNRKRFMQCVTGACLLLARQLFLDLGGFDEGFVNGYEDVDLCLRAQASGKRILYAPESVLVHFEETSAGRKEKDRQNAERFFGRWGGRIRFDVGELYEAEGLLRPIGEEQADRLYALFGANDNAVFIYHSVLSRYPSDSGALLNLGRACAANGRLAEARLFLERLLELRPGQPAALRELARLSAGAAAVA